METLKDIFVPYKIAVQLKEIGFDERCIAYFNSTSIIPDYPYMYVENYGKNSKESKNFTTAPTYKQIFKWFREKGFYCNIHRIECRDCNIHKIGSRHKTFLFRIDKDKRIYESDLCTTYEEAQEQLILKLIEIYKNGK